MDMGQEAPEVFEASGRKGFCHLANFADERQTHWFAVIQASAARL